MTDITTRLAELKALAEAQAEAYATMLDIGQGVGGLGVRQPEKFEAKRRWADSTENEHADTVLALIAALEGVTAVHRPIDALNVRVNRRQQVCTGCGTDDGNWQTWPCPTIRALGIPTTHPEVTP